MGGYVCDSGHFFIVEVCVCENSMYFPSLLKISDWF